NRLGRFAGLGVAGNAVKLWGYPFGLTPYQQTTMNVSLPQLLLLGLRTGAAEKAVSRQNEKCSNNSTGRNGFETFDDSQSKKTCGPCSPPSHQEGLFSRCPLSVSHA